MTRNALLALLAVGLCAACAQDGGGGALQVRVESVRDLGLILDPRGTRFIRDGASSGAVGGRILYGFGDTLFFDAAVDGTRYRSNTAAYAELADPTLLSEPLDARGLPQQFIPFTADEQAYNDASGRPDERIALWPGKILPRSSGRALVIVNKLKIHPGQLNYEAIGTALAELDPGSTVASRLPGLLFSAPEPGFIHGAVVRDGLLYLYACETSGRCRVARAPFERATERGSYTFWNGMSWSPSLADAALSIPGSTSGFSVSFNEAFGLYLAFFSEGFGKTVKLRTAPRPEGPWSDATDVFQFPSAIYATTQHDALDADGGRKVYVSAFRDLGNFRGEIRLLEVALAAR
jgi:hypothetical protein